MAEISEFCFRCGLKADQHPAYSCKSPTHGTIWLHDAFTDVKLYSDEHKCESFVPSISETECDADIKALKTIRRDVCLTGDKRINEANQRELDLQIKLDKLKFAFEKWQTYNPYETNYEEKSKRAWIDFLIACKEVLK